MEVRPRRDRGLKILAMQVGGQHDIPRQRTGPLMDCPPNSFNVLRKWWNGVQTFEQDDQKNKEPPFATPTIAMPPPTTLSTPMPSPTIPINVRPNRVSIVLPCGKWID